LIFSYKLIETHNTIVHHFSFIFYYLYAWKKEKGPRGPLKISIVD